MRNAFKVATLALAVSMATGCDEPPQPKSIKVNNYGDGDVTISGDINSGNPSSTAVKAGLKLENNTMPVNVEASTEEPPIGEHTLVSIPLTPDPSVTAELEAAFPSGPDYTWWGYSTGPVSLPANWRVHVQVQLSGVATASRMYIVGDEVSGDFSAPFMFELPLPVAVTNNLGSERSISGTVYPNPFVSRTGVKFSLGNTSSVEVGVFDVESRLVRALQSGRMEAGTHYVTWDGFDAEARQAKAGVYFMRVQAGNRILSTRVVRVK